MYTVFLTIHFLFKKGLRNPLIDFPIYCSMDETNYYDFDLMS